MKDLISLIVPVYKVEEYLPRCIDSMLAQTYTNLEIILVDDGSPDTCGQICDAYAARDTRIRVIHKENGGVGQARNSGLECCAGEYIMFVDSDDYLNKDAVQVLYSRMIIDGSDLAVGRHMDIYADGTTNSKFCDWMQDALISKETVFSSFAGTCHIPVAPWGKLYRREILKDIVFPKLKRGEDMWVFPRIIEKCEKISVVGRTVYYYFQRADSAMQSTEESLVLENIIAVLHLVEFFVQHGFYESACRWYAVAIDKALRLNKKREGRKLFEQVFCLSERRRLIRGQKAKTKIEWVSLYVPILYSAVRTAKRLVRRT